MKTKRTALRCLAILLALLCLTGCMSAKDQSAAPAYEGTWYFARNGVECQIGQGKIYEDDLHAKEGQTLRGVYSETEDHIEAHLAGVGSVQTARALYVVQTGQGEVLCDSPSGDGTVYFYRDPLAALETLETAQADPSPAPEESATPTPQETLPPEDQAVDSEPPSRAMPGMEQEPSPAPSARTMPGGETSSTPEPSPSPVTRGDGTMVWVPQSGSKYHSTSGCSGMKNPSQITKAEAERKGYTPCKRCY